MNNKYVLHPWHGISQGENAPGIVNAFIEITPHDNVKYEIDKESGYLKVNRPQLYSNIVPALYGFIPMTYCGDRIAGHCMTATGRQDIKGDGDPLDICVLTERNILQGNILVDAIPIGGFRMIDKNEADDKIIAIMEGDRVYSQWQDINQMPESLKERLLHYFLTYKTKPFDTKKNVVEITHVYGREEAKEIISLAIEDYSTLIQNDFKK